MVGKGSLKSEGSEITTPIIFQFSQKSERASGWGDEMYMNVMKRETAHLYQVGPQSYKAVLNISHFLISGAASYKCVPVSKAGQTDHPMLRIKQIWSYLSPSITSLSK